MTGILQQSDSSHHDARVREVEDAEHSGEMEGFHLTAATRNDAGDYVAGKIDVDQLRDRVRARYGIL